MVLKLKNHLEGLLKLNCWLHRWSFWFNWSWVGLRVCIYQKFLGDAMLLVWGPHFGNLCVRGREEGTGEYLALNVIFLWSEIWFFKKSFIYLFLERRERREKVRKRNINQSPLAYPQSRVQPATQAPTPTGIQTSDHLVCDMTPKPLSHTSQGWYLMF